MTELIHITDATPLEDRWLRVRFSDGVVKDVDLGPIFAQGGVFAPIRDDRAVFEQVRVDSDTQTVTWPGDVDLDPAVLYGLHEPASGVRFTRRVVQPA